MAGQEAEIGALGVIILAGVAGRLFLKKTGVSDVFLLLLFGAAAGALLPPAAVDWLGLLMLPLGAVALLMIMMDEGLRLSFQSLRRQAHKALFFGLASFGLSFLLSFSLAYFGFELGVFQSLIIAAIFSSVAPELLSGFMSSLRASESAKAVGEIEAALSDSLSVMLALLLAGAVAQGGGISISALPQDIALALLLSAACGALLAAIWKAFVASLAEGNEHLAAIGLAAGLYWFSGTIGANGVVAVFVFSFFLGNTSHSSIVEVRKFQSEITFFLRTFFFIYLGVLLFHSPKSAEVAVFAAALALVLALARMAASRAVALFDSTLREGRLLETVSSRGLSSAVLSVIVAGELGTNGTAAAIDLPLLALFVIFFSNLITAWLVLRKRER
jgi:potassium/hydrogen antiporter